MPPGCHFSKRAALSVLHKHGIGAVVLTLALVCTAPTFFHWRPIYETRTPRFAKEIERVADPLELQKWAMDILRDAKPGARKDARFSGSDACLQGNPRPGIADA
jgi:hypothetical protein